MPLLAISVIGPDGPGIIAGITGVLAGFDGNIEDSSMTLLRSHFAMTLIVAVDRDAATVEAAINAMTEPRGLLLSVREVAPEPGLLSTGSHRVLRVHGGDHPGIVSALTSVVAAHGGNITDLTTRLTDDLYVLVAEFDLPPDADDAALMQELDASAARLGVEASVDVADADLL